MLFRSENTGLEVPVRYNERECILEINTEYSTLEVFAALATEISFARLHDRGMNRDYDRGAFQLNAESVGFMVCRRFGVDCPVPDASGADIDIHVPASSLQAYQEEWRRVNNVIGDL